MNSRFRYKLKRIHTALFTAALVIASMAFGPVEVHGASRSKQREFTVVIDAGHGGHDHGAVDNGVREKDINLGVAQKFAALVKKKMKNVKVVMTRDDDTFISLQERANIANRNKGNLFISIHTNSVDKSNPNRRKVRGTSVYALGPQKDANNLKVAQRENSVIELEDNYHQKYSGFDPAKDESYIIFEMAQKKSLGQSLRFADKAQKELVKTAGREDRGVKQAGFWVLWATSMPSVLVELDFICNPTQAAYLGSNAGQQELAQALFNALKAYTENQGNPTVATQTAPVPESAPGSASSAESDTDNVGVGTLVAAGRKDTGRREHVANARSHSSSGQRRRRSESSRQTSQNRDVSVDSIELRSETDYLARQEKTEVKKDEPQPQPEDNPRDKKKKKDKKKDKVKKKNKKDTSDKKKRKSPNTKTFKVENAGKRQGGSNGITPVVSEGGTRAATQSPAKGRMVYKIVLLASEKELKNSDAAFCGLKPTGMFVEHGLYKYTYGDTVNRREIEQKLLEVKTLIPGAVIIVKNE